MKLKLSTLSILILIIFFGYHYMTRTDDVIVNIEQPKYSPPPQLTPIPLNIDETGLTPILIPADDEITPLSLEELY